ncbi:hypothetical protein HYH02_014195 [Chlamydomonas schloesseri]|uniref:Protein kinase domain-containing protein n=1 Tax=Chlamydomonas schloesseri TaxID=2026947 RepID=A0A835SKJ6_9CHLO|nr:hypothetical protein HYH02_014195 [Chlamydomonas schloesseri]|eukprot:KAG2428872.1 hypothetical protein HYH02_014195 [Chlamydomonas schloesseri]
MAVVASIGHQQGIAVNKATGCSVHDVESGAAGARDIPGEWPAKYRSGAADTLGLLDIKTEIWSNVGVKYGPRGEPGQPWNFDTPPSSSDSCCGGLVSGDVPARSSKELSGMVVTTSQGLVAAAAASSELAPAAIASSAEATPAPVPNPGPAIVVSPKKAAAYQVPPPKPAPAIMKSQQHPGAAAVLSEAVAAKPGIKNDMPATAKHALPSRTGGADRYPFQRGNLRPFPTTCRASSSSSSSSSCPSRIMTRIAVRDHEQPHTAGGHGQVGRCRLAITRTTVSTCTSTSEDADNAVLSYSVTRTTKAAIWKRVAWGLAKPPPAQPQPHDTNAAPAPAAASSAPSKQQAAFESEVAAHIDVTNQGCRHVAACYGFRQTPVDGALYLEEGSTDLAGIWGDFKASKHSLPEEALRVVLASVLRGLRATHAAGWAHLDVKLENVVLGADGLLKLVDFGLARPIATSAAASSISSSATSAATRRPAGTLTQVITGGTRGYTAPELIARAPLGRNPAKWLEEPTSGPAADVYSLGCMAFYLATRPEHVYILQTRNAKTGRHALALPADAEVRRNMMSELSPALRGLIESMLSAGPADRPGVEAALAHPALRGCEGMAARRWRWGR